MQRFNGYNRNDFYFPRTSREAFGENVKFHDKYANLGGILYVSCLIMAVAVVTALFS